MWLAKKIASLIMGLPSAPACTDNVVFVARHKNGRVAFIIAAAGTVEPATGSLDLIFFDNCASLGSTRSSGETTKGVSEVYLLIFRKFM
ncbi:hypothetical protein HK19_00250 [Acetobacter persici]|nr:hypothetical protein HK19_00250 [Acetobacter persici]